MCGSMWLCPAMVVVQPIRISIPFWAQLGNGFEPYWVSALKA